MSPLTRLVTRIKQSKPVTFIVRIDHKISDWLEHFVRSHSVVSKFFVFFKEITNFVGIPLILIILFLNLPLQRAVKLSVLWILILLFIEYVVKNVIKRKRPYHIDGKWAGTEKIKSFSFPSSHAYVAGFLTTIWLLLHLPAAYFFVPIFLLLPISRVALNYHFFVDVITGFVLGVLVAVLGIMLI